MRRREFIAMRLAPRTTWGDVARPCLSTMKHRLARAKPRAGGRGRA